MTEFISRDEVLEHSEYTENFNLVVPVRFIKAMKAADVQPVRRGEWQQDGATHKRCSNCKQFLVPNLKSSMFAYCPNCGARMKQEG